MRRPLRLHPARLPLQACPESPRRGDGKREVGRGGEAESEGDSRCMEARCPEVAKDGSWCISRGRRGSQHAWPRGTAKSMAHRSRSSCVTGECCRADRSPAAIGTKTEASARRPVDLLVGTAPARAAAGLRSLGAPAECSARGSPHPSGIWRSHAMAVELIICSCMMLAFSMGAPPIHC
mmetsp:Transcript_54658/g.169561  ORF Transcript_54658/g.169561 Transcript_54658/m.169561 type:complete len:179 (-) Transcript_54658:452-988(-)